jgi:hypothetical protein
MKRIVASLLTCCLLTLTLPPLNALAQRHRKRARRTGKWVTVTRPINGINGFDSRRRIITLPSNSFRLLQLEAENYQEQYGGERDYLEAYLHWLRQRTYPRDTLDWRAYQRAYRKRDRMEALRIEGLEGIVGMDAVTPKWEFVGPVNLPTPYRYFFGRGRLAGRVNDLTFDPTTPGTYYVAAAGGLWRTTTRGEDWSCLSNEWTNQYVSSVAVHPTNANIIFAGTGDFDGDTAGEGAHGFGVMRSTDRGATWTNLLRTELAGFSIRRIIVDRDNPNIVTVAAGRHATIWGRVWRSTNGGDSWARVIESDNAGNNVNAEWCDLEQGARDASGRRYIYAVGLDDNGGQMWRSSNQGASWDKLTIPTQKVRQRSLDIAASPTDPNTVYLLSGVDKKIWKSTTAGNSWSETTGNFPNGNAVAGSNYNWSQQYYDAYITCSTRADNHRDVLYVGLIDLVASVDGGATWQSVGHVYDRDQQGAPLAEMHGDQHRAVVNPADSNEVLVANDGGVFLTSYNPAANTWTFNTAMNRGLGITQIFQAAFHPTDANRMIGGTQDNATPVGSGDPIVWSNEGEGDGGFCAINPTNSDVQYATSQGMTIYRTGDNWASSPDDITPNYGDQPGNWFGPITLDPSNSSLLYVGTLYLHRRDDSATTNKWKMRLGNQQLAGDADNYTTFIAVAPSDSNRIYTGASDGQVWMSKDKGEHWQRINTGVGASSVPLPNRWVTSIAVHPNNPDVILVGLSGTGSSHLWRCDDTRSTARTWKNVSGTMAATSLPDIPLNTVVIDPRDPAQVYYVGTDIGVFFSRDGGVNWANATASLGLPNVQVNVLKWVPGTGFLMAATFGRGIWRIRMPVRDEHFRLTIR